MKKAFKQQKKCFFIFSSSLSLTIPLKQVHIPYFHFWLVYLVIASLFRPLTMANDSPFYLTFPAIYNRLLFGSSRLTSYRCCPQSPRRPLSPVKALTQIYEQLTRGYTTFFCPVFCCCCWPVCNQQFSSHNWRPFIRWSIWLSSHFSHLLLYVTSPPPTPKMCVLLRRMEKEEREKWIFYVFQMDPSGGRWKMCFIFHFTNLNSQYVRTQWSISSASWESYEMYERRCQSFDDMANEAPNCRITHKTFWRHTKNLAQQTSNGAN